MKQMYEKAIQEAESEEVRSLSVSDIMTSPVITAKEWTGVRDIAKMMKKHNVDAIVIANKQNEPVGIITEGDIVKRVVSSKRNLWPFLSAKQIMSRPVMAVARHISLEDAAKYMVDHRVSKLCVLDGERKLVGIITTDDITKNATYLINELKEVIKTGYFMGEEAKTRMHWPFGR